MHRNVTIISYFLAVLLMLTQLISHPCFRNERITSTAKKYESRLGNGCYHVFIDAGSNRGVHGRFLFEPEKYPQSEFSKKLDIVFGGNRTRQNICVFAFEPNPKHISSQCTTEVFYARMGWRYHFMPYGVSDSGGNLTFYRNQLLNCNGNCEEWGFSTVSAAGGPNDTDSIVVNVLNFSSWLEKHILARDIPEKNSYNILPSSLVMKMDIEGSEYQVLLNLLESGVSHKFDHIIGEFHSHHGNSHVINGIVMQNAEVADFEKNLTSRLQANGGPGFLEFDDEQYLHDGMEYPIQNNN